MTISIDGRPSTTALVSVPGLASRIGADEQSTLQQLKRGKVPLQSHGGVAWAPVASSKVQALLQRAGMDELQLFTGAGGARVLKVRRGPIDAALAGQQALFATALHQPVAELDQLRGVGAVRVQRAVTSSSGAGSALARIAFTVGRKSLPYAAGAVPAVLIGTRLASMVGDQLEPTQDQRTRRAGALLGATVVTTAGGIGIARAIAPELPTVAKAARGVAAGGVALGLLTLGAAQAISATDGKG
jgi:hypothetical protein